MIYLFFQISLWLLLATLLGLFMGWLVWGQVNSVDRSGVGGNDVGGNDVGGNDVDGNGVDNLSASGGFDPAAEPDQTANQNDIKGSVVNPDELETTGETSLAEWQKAEPRAAIPDNLKKIRGVGPIVEKALNQIGIFHYQQIAEFTPEKIALVNQALNSSGMIERDNWIDQAKILADR